MLLEFTKMHGLGNDFVVIDAINQSVDLNQASLRRMADRHTGIGCDQILLVEASQHPQAQYRYRIFNADGGEVGQCGNGARCFARFVTDKGMTTDNPIVVETQSGLLSLQLQADGQVCVDMGVPQLEPADIPLVAEQRQSSYSIEVARKDLDIMAVSMGNPHAVLRVIDVDLADVAGLGPSIESLERFPERVNAGFMQIIDRQTIKLRVFERGSGETQACGSGACAAVVAGCLQGWLDQQVTVVLHGGELVISWPGEGESVFMTGPVATVFEGRIDI
ncbi:MAG TPA: diaminopimelate epimerase [Gammaproteobacteria bacterium]|nr:diaminopimelate epimerase [Gammaproteobacteria bacterium]